MEKEHLSQQKPRVPVFEMKIKAHVTGEDLGYFMLDEKAIYVGDKSGTVSHGLDHVYQHDNNVKEVWDGIRPELSQGLRGENVCLISYGESQTQKTSQFCELIRTTIR